MRYFAGLFVLLTICSAPRSLAQQMSDSGHSISGFVRDYGSNALVQGAMVDIFTSGNRVQPFVLSGTDGEFQFSELRAGDYAIAATKSGYDTATVNVSVLRGNAPFITILLRKTVSSQSLAATNTISVRQLSLPPKAEEAFRSGHQLLEADGQPAKAVTEFQRAIQAFPSYYEAYTEIAVADYRLNKLQDSETALKKAIDLSSNKYPEALILLAELCNDHGRFDEAEMFAQQAVDLEEPSWHAHFALARALLGQHRAEEADLSASRARELKPDNSQVYLLLANAHMLEHQYSAMLEDFDAFLKLEPHGPQSDEVLQRRNHLQQRLENPPSPQNDPSEQP